ncbi:MAG: helix-turn-helix domain-containing protein [Archaeoglobaceae archaeon]|nr:helix-turn-helix domain-containing protein [Archaeoglobaceae archaeon]MCX8152011.1 helix-turn-helix domain-containing protein [Archaeoglobaceae archaeon]MDW8013400.1 helix-turn-helix domain-containing protein [Archaeoglobaceae archaeon]
MEFRIVAERICGDIVLSDDHGGALKKWRKIFKLTQSEVARRLKVTPSVISDYESSKRRPGVNFVKRFVETLIEADAERGYEVLSKYSFFFETTSIIDLAEYNKPVNFLDFCKVIEAERVNNYEKTVNGHTIIDSIKAIIEMNAFDFYRLYGLTTERALIFTKVSSGRSPLVAIRVSALKPAVAVLHGIKAKDVDEIAKKIAEVEKLPLLVTTLPVDDVVSRLRGEFA